jgi:parallel beta-helix repeat protein
MRLVTILLAVLALSVTGFSATWYVPDDYGTIQEAIDVSMSKDIIVVKPGTYVENIDFLGKDITVKSEQGSDVTLIDGNLAGSVVTCENGESPDSVLDGFTITNGSGTDVSGYYYGGGIYNDGSNPTVTNCTFSENYAGDGSYAYGFGGGMYNNNSSPEVTNCTFSGNTAIGYACGFGGGMCNSNSSPTLTNCTFSGNDAHDGDYGCGSGGGMYNTGSHPTLTDCTFTGNWGSEAGGGMCNSNSDPTLTNCTFSGNSSPTLTNCTFTGNHGDYRGGGMFNYLSTPTLTDCTFSGNSVYGGLGGGMYNWDSSPTLTNCTFSGNSAYEPIDQDGLGGGMYNGDSSPTLTNCTFIGNLAGEYGGGMSSSYPSSSTVTNCILWDNIPDQVNGTGATLTYCCIQGGYPGTGNIDADPLFVVGPNGLYYLSQIAAGQSKDSPCVNAGSDFASNLGMDLVWTRTDAVTDSGVVDMGFHYGPFSAGWTVPLYSDTYVIPEDTGGVSNFIFNAGEDNANRNYILLGSVSGTDPGTPLPGGMATLPINWDAFTNIVLTLLNTSVFVNFLGTLDGSGTATAQLNVPPVTGFAPLTMHYAYALNNPWDFVSNPVAVEIVQ